MEGTRLTGLWKNTGKDGKTYLSGNLSGVARLLILPNTHKREEKDPDYHAYVVPNEKREAKPAPKDEGDSL
jgi:uncharacterized protein (DUF736 family)